MQTPEQQLAKTRKLAWIAIVAAIAAAVGVALDIIMNEAIFTKYLQ